MIYRFVLTFLRDFRLLLEQDSEGFADNFRIDVGDGGGQGVVDLSHVFSGSLEGRFKDIYLYEIKPFSAPCFTSHFSTPLVLDLFF